MLDTMLQAIHLERSAASSCGKVVIVSNFKTMLDLTLRLLSCRGWGEEVLRLDGSVACDLRQGLVERFNRDSDPCWVFLLAAKAGGVGLNLIGANRLIMLDCDWVSVACLIYFYFTVHSDFATIIPLLSRIHLSIFRLWLGYGVKDSIDLSRSTALFARGKLNRALWR